MQLPLTPPLLPMLAKAATKIPEQPTKGPLKWLYEPKWDGFRTLIFRDGPEVFLCSRSGKDLSRYFPEMVDTVRRELPERCVVDGELVVPRNTGGKIRPDWDSLSARVHPAASRVALLSKESPSQFIGFDMLALDDEDFCGKPLSERRQILVQVLASGQHCRATAATTDSDQAQDWFTTFEGAGLDGIIAKNLSGQYLSNKREMMKIKHSRTADCVVMGYRLHKSSPGIGSILLGLFADNELTMVGGASAFTAAKRVEIFELLQPLLLGDNVVQEGEGNRWKTSTERQWVPLRPELVVEVGYDQMEGDRFRHAVRFLRWRPDREPASCTYDQLEIPARYDFSEVLITGSAVMKDEGAL
ncbi:MAG: ATP-dependent DNA ligase [Mycobacteriaceae bacterium]